MFVQKGITWSSIAAKKPNKPAFVSMIPHPDFPVEFRYPDEEEGPDCEREREKEEKAVVPFEDDDGSKKGSSPSHSPISSDREDGPDDDSASAADTFDVISRPTSPGLAGLSEEEEDRCCSVGAGTHEDEGDVASQASELGDEESPDEVEKKPTENNNDEHTRRLHHEIVHFNEAMQLDVDEFAARETLLETLKGLIQDTFPDIQLDVQVFGSYATDLQLPWGDLDVCVLGFPKETMLGNMYKLADALTPLCRSIEVITTATVPVTKLVDIRSGISVDITFTPTGLRSSELVANCVARYPSARPLLLFLKHLLCLRGLLNLWTGGLSSYNLCLLVVSFLQCETEEDISAMCGEELDDDDDEPGLTTNDNDDDDNNSAGAVSCGKPKFTSHHRSLIKQHHLHQSSLSNKNDDNLGHLLLRFLHYYGVSFAYEDWGISVLGGGGLFLRSSRGMEAGGTKEGGGPADKQGTGSILCLEDPFNPQNDLGKKVFAMDKIKTLFAQVYEVLTVPLPPLETPNTRHPSFAILSRVFPPAPPQPQVQFLVQHPSQHQQQQQQHQQERRGRNHHHHNQNYHTHRENRRRNRGRTNNRWTNYNNQNQYHNNNNQQQHYNSNPAAHAQQNHHQQQQQQQYHKALPTFVVVTAPVPPQLANNANSNPHPSQPQQQQHHHPRPATANGPTRPPLSHRVR